MTLNERLAGSKDSLLTAQEAAELLGVSKSWLVRNAVPYVRLGRRMRRYRRMELDGYVESNIIRRPAREAL